LRRLRHTPPHIKKSRRDVIRPGRKEARRGCHLSAVPPPSNAPFNPPAWPPTTKRTPAERAWLSSCFVVRRRPLVILRCCPLCSPLKRPACRSRCAGQIFSLLAKLLLTEIYCRAPPGNKWVLFDAASDTEGPQRLERFPGPEPALRRAERRERNVFLNRTPLRSLAWRCREGYQGKQ